MKTAFLHKLCGALILALGLLILPGQAAAQEQSGEASEEAQGEEAGQTETGRAETGQSGIKTLPPAYEDQLMRLSEILGALHYLRNLCDAKEGQLWREEMQKLIAAEQPSQQSQAQMIAAFNRGFRGYAEIHRECNEPAIEAANQFLAQGTRIAAEIPNRYGR